MKRRDWIPGAEGKLVDLCREWVLILGRPTNVTRWGWDSLEVSGVVAHINNFIAVREAYQVNKTALNRLDKEEMKKTAVAAMRSFANTSIRFNSKMIDSDRLALGIRPKDTNPTEESAPSTVPEIETNSSVIRQLGFRLRDYGSKSWAKPDHVGSMQLKWEIAETRPADAGEMANTENATANPITITFRDEQRGKHVYYAARWFNHTDKVGPWSDIESAFVP